MEPVPRLTESQLDQMLALHQKLEVFGFRLPIPRFLREIGQSTSELVLASEIQVRTGLSVTCAIRLLLVSGGEKHSTQVTVSERIPNSVAGRGEISIVLSGEKDGRCFLSSRIGKDASGDLKRLCGGLRIDCLVVNENKRTTPEIAESQLQALAIWINTILQGRTNETPTL